MEALASALPDVLNASVGELNFKNVVNKLGDVMYTFPFSLPPYYIAIIRCLGVLEGVAIQVREAVCHFCCAAAGVAENTWHEFWESSLFSRQSRIGLIGLLVNHRQVAARTRPDRSCNFTAFWSWCTSVVLSLLYLI